MLLKECGSEPPPKQDSGWRDGGTLGRISLQRRGGEEQGKEEQEEGRLHRKSKFRSNNSTCYVNENHPWRSLGAGSSSSPTFSYSHRSRGKSRVRL